jgi:hypothetical protein
MISPSAGMDTVEIVVPNSKYRQCVAVEKQKIYASVANGSHPSTDHGGGKRRLCSAKFVLIEINVGIHKSSIICCCGGLRLGLIAMASAAHYRKLAEECLEWAHEARDVSVRQHYAKLCQIWLECAARAELRCAVIAPPEQEPTIAQKVA